MRLNVVNYGHPALRQRGARIEAVTPEIQSLAANMIETMHAAHGIGLAGQQVAKPLQIFVLDLREVSDRPSTLEWEGEPANIADRMPMVLINPEVTPLDGITDTGPEGCLSFPEIFAEKITRPASVRVTAWNERGEIIRFACGGLLARAVQHEHDHLRGILYIDRMTSAERRRWQPELDALQDATRTELQKGQIMQRESLGD